MVEFHHAERGAAPPTYDEVSKAFYRELVAKHPDVRFPPRPTGRPRTTRQDRAELRRFMLEDMGHPVAEVDLIVPAED
jgi:hypothetical protein